MDMTTLLRRVVGVAVIALVLAVPAAAKEGAQAHLLSPLPRHAAPGSWVTIRWTVDVPGNNGKRIPFNALGMFVRLRGIDGAVTRATARQMEGPTLQCSRSRSSRRHPRSSLRTDGHELSPQWMRR